MLTNRQKNHITVGLIVGVCSIAVLTVAFPIPTLAAGRKQQRLQQSQQASQNGIVKPTPLKDDMKVFIRPQE
ncbi:hypothetical protein BASA61_003627 [Batrachochytrium salamandrivorans]|nr:hypothetical protein BASA62_000877 [Batrachochytrium salamandrivorans]KAH6595958.1 hypothetical protein BASA61_003627 [Batrachochytrium salamandrivorans]KAH9248213.1 hypothetical protein BASA81_014134 [Batrachochytrium salamandrivorans]KAJ1340778.1 hypothetical protein BSLG_004872 [Batrachochytrium salamandrivorans]